jgi:hypothetical protein
MPVKNRFAAGIVASDLGYKSYGTGVTTAKKPWAKKNVRSGTAQTRRNKAINKASSSSRSSTTNSSNEAVDMSPGALRRRREARARARAKTRARAKARAKASSS